MSYEKSMKNIVEFAKIIRSIYEEQHEELGIPFFQGFPKNCCEGASFFFGHIAQDIFPNKVIEIVKGCRFDDNGEEYHYWVEINGDIFDLTADQFNNVDMPIFGMKTESSHLGFRELERECISCYLLFYTENCLEIERFNPIKAKIIRQMKQYS
jgi:hypothetical protein